MRQSLKKIWMRKSDLMGLFGVVGYRGSQFVLQLGLALLLPNTQYAQLFLFLTAVNAFAGIAGESLGLTFARRLRSSDKGEQRLLISDLFILFFLGILTGFGFLLYFLIFKENILAYRDLLGFGFTLVVFTTLNLILQYLLIVFDLERWLLRSQLLYGLLLTGFVLFVFSGSSNVEILVAVVVASAVLLFLQLFFLLFYRRTVWRSFNLKFEFSFMQFYKLVVEAGQIALPMLLGTPVHLIGLSILRLFDDQSGIEMANFAFAFLFYTLVSFIPGASGSFVVKHFTDVELNGRTQGATLSLIGLPGVKRLKSLIMTYFSLVSVPVVLLLVFAPFILTQLLPKFESSLKTVCVLILAGAVAGATMIIGHYFNSLFKSFKVTQYLAIYAACYLSMSLVLVGHFRLGALGLALSLLFAVSVQLLSMLKFLAFERKM